MTPEMRRESARKAVRARWAKAKGVEVLPPIGPLPVATHRGFLNLMGAEIPCYVLSNGQKVIGRTSATEMLTGIKGGGDLEKYLGVNQLKPFINMELVLERMAAFRLPEVEGLGFFAMARHFAGDSAAARAAPPFVPPRLPRSTADAFFPSFGSGSDASPVERSTISFANLFTSRGRFGMMRVSRFAPQGSN